MLDNGKCLCSRQVILGSFTKLLFCFVVVMMSNPFCAGTQHFPHCSRSTVARHLAKSWDIQKEQDQLSHINTSGDRSGVCSSSTASLSTSFWEHTKICKAGDDEDSASEHSTSFSAAYCWGYLEMVLFSASSNFYLCSWDFILTSLLLANVGCCYLPSAY